MKKIIVLYFLIAFCSVAHAASRWTTVTTTTASISPHASLIFTMTATASDVDIGKVVVTPSSGGGTTTFGIYKHATCLTADVVYSKGNFSGTWTDPMMSVGGVLVSGTEAYIATYEDLDATNKIHCRITNNAASSKIYAVTIKYEAVGSGGSSGPFFNVLNYGADPTGVADSTTAINNTITAAQSGHGSVYVPGGTYWVSGVLNITAPISVFGDGPNQSIITTSNATAHIFNIVISAPTSYDKVTPFTIRDMQLTASVEKTAGDFIHIEGTTNGLHSPRIVNVLFYHHLIGVHIYAAGAVQITECTFWESRTGDAKVIAKDIQIQNTLNTDGGDDMIYHNWFRHRDVSDALYPPGKTYYAVYQIDAGGVRFEGNKFISADYSRGYYLDVPVQTPAISTGQLYINDNSFDGAWGLGGYRAIDLHVGAGAGFDSFIITRNFIASNTSSYGVYVDIGATNGYGTISDNQIAATTGIALVTGTTWDIHNNLISGTTGITIASAVTYVKIGPNTITSTTPLVDSASSTEYIAAYSPPTGIETLPDVKFKHPSSVAEVLLKSNGNVNIFGTQTVLKSDTWPQVGIASADGTYQLQMGYDLISGRGIIEAQNPSGTIPNIAFNVNAFGSIGGVTVGAPTGTADQGPGTINVSGGYYINGVAIGGGVTGSSTAGYFTKWFGATSLTGQSGILPTDIAGAGDIALNNNAAYRVKDTGGTPRVIAYVDNANQSILGSSGVSGATYINAGGSVIGGISIAATTGAVTIPNLINGSGYTHVCVSATTGVLSACP